YRFSLGFRQQEFVGGERSPVARMKRSEIRGGRSASRAAPDCAEPVIGRAFARPVGSIRATQSARCASLPRLHLGPEPVDDALGGGVTRIDDEQLFLRRFVRIDIPVVED